MKYLLALLLTILSIPPLFATEENDNQQVLEQLVGISESGDTASMSQLLDKIDNRIADKNERTEFYNYFLKVASNYTTSPEIIKLLVNRGAVVTAVDYDGISPLVWASIRHKKEIIQTLINLGANPNELITDQDGMTMPLICQAASRNIDVFDILIKNNADVNILFTLGSTDDGRPITMTPLHFIAMSCGGEDVPDSTEGQMMKAATTRLIDAGANVNALDSNGTTPLDFAIINRADYIADILIKYGGKSTL